MYIYSDTASYTNVGGTKAPLLRVCNSGGGFGGTISKSFVHPLYVPLSHNDIETIEVNINNELGLPMPFQFGKSVVTLDFRRKHSFSATT